MIDGGKLVQAIRQLQIAFEEAGMKPPKAIVLSNDKEWERLALYVSSLSFIDKGPPGLNTVLSILETQVDSPSAAAMNGYWKGHAAGCEETEKSINDMIAQYARAA